MKPNDLPEEIEDWLKVSCVLKDGIFSHAIFYSFNRSPRTWESECECVCVCEKEREKEEEIGVVYLVCIREKKNVFDVSHCNRKRVSQKG